MKLEEVLEAFRNGKNIRRKTWIDGGVAPWIHVKDASTHLPLKDMIATDWEIEPAPLKTKTVWLWRWQNLADRIWLTSTVLWSEEELPFKIKELGAVKHAGPFEVPE